MLLVFSVNKIYPNLHHIPPEEMEDPEIQEAIAMVEDFRDYDARVNVHPKSILAIVCSCFMIVSVVFRLKQYPYAFLAFGGIATIPLFLLGTIAMKILVGFSLLGIVLMAWAVVKQKKNLEQAVETA